MKRKHTCPGLRKSCWLDNFLHCCASSVPSRGIGVERSGRPDVLMTSLTQSGEAYICICPSQKGKEIGCKYGANRVIDNNKVVPLS